MEWIWPLGRPRYDTYDTVDASEILHTQDPQILHTPQLHTPKQRDEIFQGQFMKFQA